MRDGGDATEATHLTTAPVKQASCCDSQSLGALCVVTALYFMLAVAELVDGRGQQSALAPPARC